nr:putative ubiquitin carboxyl-terminal hydrolase [Oceanusvirus sp.]
MRNLGNTCFAAAVVWALRPCERVRNLVSVETSPIHRMLKRLFERPDDGETWASFVRQVDTMIGRRGREPHDSHETLCAILDKAGGPLERLFTINFQRSVKCSSCGKTAKAKETNVYVACEHAASLAAGLAGSHAPTKVEKRECDFCDRKADGILRTVPKTPAPGMLVIRTCQRKLWMEHCIGYCGARYRLRSVIVHMGSSDHGHYAALVMDKSGKAWAMCDDDAVRRASVPIVQGASEISNPSTVIYERVVM